MSNHATVREQLHQRLTQLLRRSERIEGDLRQPHNPDWQERATELENDEVLEGLDAMSLAEARQIRLALTRIDHGSYGTCAKCGRPISADRLAALPSTATCVKCAS